MRVAWLSLDEGDTDLTHFLTYLIAALQTITSQIGEATLVSLQSSQPPSSDVLLTTLLNDLTTLGDIVLVLDDYHVIESVPIDEVLTFIVDHLPPNLRLVIASREDPPLLLAWLRARGQLTELRATDLRFTPNEAADFLNRVMGLHLSAQDIAALEIHRRVSVWFEQHDLPTDAIWHALTAKDFDRAANLIELAGSATEDGRIQSAAFLSWLKALPAEL